MYSAHLVAIKRSDSLQNSIKESSITHHCSFKMIVRSHTLVYLCTLLLLLFILVFILLHYIHVKIAQIPLLCTEFTKILLTLFFPTLVMKLVRNQSSLQHKRKGAYNLLIP